MRTLCCALLLLLATCSYAGNVPCSDELPSVIASRSMPGSGAGVLAVKTETIQPTKTPTTTTIITKNECSPIAFNTGVCCYDCELPTYIENSVRKPVCNCNGRHQIRANSLPHCYPFKNLNLTGNDGPSYAAKGMFRGCVAIGCTCKFVTDQLIEVYPGNSPPLGSLADGNRLSSLKAMNNYILQISLNRTVSPVTVAKMTNITSAIMSLYTMNGVGDLVATRGADVQQLDKLTQLVADLDSYQWTQVVTFATYSAVENVVKYGVSEAYRLITIYKGLLTSQRTDIAAVDVTLPFKITATLTKASSTLLSFY